MLLPPIAATDTVSASAIGLRPERLEFLGVDISIFPKYFNVNNKVCFSTFSAQKSRLCIAVLAISHEYRRYAGIKLQFAINF